MTTDRDEDLTTLFLGGIRSGKSDAAVAAAVAAGRQVVVVATGTPSDTEMAARIARHRRRRPTAWSTVETTDVADALDTAPTGATVLVDGLGTWAACRVELDDTKADKEIDLLVDALQRRHRIAARTLIVSDEVGLSLVPPNPAGRRFCDLLGETNQRVAAVSDSVRLFVAGRSIHL